MKMRALSLLCIAPLLATAPAQAQSASRAALTEASRAVAKPLLTARYGKHRSAVGALRLPRGAGPFPVAVLIPGACRDKGVNTAAPLAEALAERGFATWNLEYPQADADDLQSVADGIDYLRVLAETQPLDLARVTLIGHARGAHLALRAVARPRPDGDTRIAALPVQAVFALDGSDEARCADPAIPPPIDRLPLGVAQYFVPADHAAKMAPYIEAARNAGDPVAVLGSGGADHFNILTPSSPQGRDVIAFIAGHAP